MTYQPVFPGGGNLGWTFLKKTRENQQEAFNQSTQIKRDTDYFREKIGSINSAEELVSDRRLLSVALASFGLSADIDNKFYIRKVLEEGTLSEDAFANRLADKRYFEMAKSFAFDLSPSNVVKSDFPDQMISQFKEREFEVAVGNADEDLRLALGLDRELSALSERGLSEEAAWFTIMGTPPLRRVFETALGLPTQLGAIDIDRQLQLFQEKSEKIFGIADPVAFIDEDRQEKLIRNFLVRSELTNGSLTTASGSVALSLLQSQPSLF